MTHTTITRLLVLLVVWSLTALFVVLQADRVATQRLAAAEIELQEATQEEDAMRQLGVVDVLPDGTNVIGNVLTRCQTCNEATDGSIYYCPKCAFGLEYSSAIRQLYPYITDYVRNRNAADANTIVNALQRESEARNIDPLLILAIIEVESSFNPDCLGAAGEYGLMQIHPCWVGNDAIGSPTVAELWSIDGNIAAGVAIFKRNYTDDYLAALGAYNTGGGRNKVYEQAVDARYKRIVMEFYFRLSGRR